MVRKPHSCMQPQRKNRIKSGDRGGHGNGSLRPIHRHGKFLSRNSRSSRIQCGVAPSFWRVTFGWRRPSERKQIIETYPAMEHNMHSNCEHCFRTREPNVGSQNPKFCNSDYHAGFAVQKAVIIVSPSDHGHSGQSFGSNTWPADFVFMHFQTKMNSLQGYPEIWNSLLVAWWVISKGCVEMPHDACGLRGSLFKSFLTGRLERELQMVQLSATRCSCITILWVSLVSFVTITLCVASQRMFIVVIYFVIDSVRKLLDISLVCQRFQKAYMYPSYARRYLFQTVSPSV
jgi:hypothetical protein